MPARGVRAKTNGSRLWKTPASRASGYFARIARWTALTSAGARTTRPVPLMTGVPSMRSPRIEHGCSATGPPRFRRFVLPVSSSLMTTSSSPSRAIQTGVVIGVPLRRHVVRATYFAAETMSMSCGSVDMASVCRSAVQRSGALETQHERDDRQDEDHRGRRQPGEVLGPHVEEGSAEEVEDQADRRRDPERRPPDADEQSQTASRLEGTEPWEPGVRDADLAQRLDDLRRSPELQAGRDGEEHSQEDGDDDIGDEHGDSKGSGNSMVTHPNR